MENYLYYLSIYLYLSFMRSKILEKLNKNTTLTNKSVREAES